MGALLCEGMPKTFSSLVFFGIVVLALLGAVYAAGTCETYEFEAPHREWSAACVAQWLSNIGLAHRVGPFESAQIQGKDLLGLNDTMLAVPAEEGGLNVTAEIDRNKLLDGVKRLEQHDPSDSTDSGLYLPLMLTGCGAFIYIMFIKDGDLERNVLRTWRKMAKKANAGRDQDGVRTDNGDWLAGTAASSGAARKRTRGKK